MSRRKRVLFVVAAVAVLACAAGLTTWRLVWAYPKRLAEVVPGVLVRSSQPGGSQYGRLCRRYGVRTIVSLREFRPTAPWQLEEERWCAEHGVRYVHIPIIEDIPTREQTLGFLRAVREGPRAVMVHCELGRSRTGKMVAAYRIIMQDASPEEAFGEMERFRFRGTPKEVQDVRDWLAGLARDKAALQAAAATTTASQPCE